MATILASISPDKLGFAKEHDDRVFVIVDAVYEVGDVVYGDYLPFERERVKSVEKLQLDLWGKQWDIKAYSYDYYRTATQFEKYNAVTGKYEVVNSNYHEYFTAIRREGGNNETNNILQTLR